MSSVFLPLSRAEAGMQRAAHATAIKASFFMALPHQ